MVKVVDCYCQDFFLSSTDKTQLKKELETYIHAIEIDKDELDVCINRCNNVVQKYGLTNIKWDFENADALLTSKYDGKMDYVVGNPPYVKIHNLKQISSLVKNFSFSSSGMTNLYICFYEISLKMLNDKGMLSYITPSSFFTSVAGVTMRKHFIENNLIESICDLKHYQPFDASTYTTIVCLNKRKNQKMLKYYEFDSNNLTPVFVDELTENDYYINESFYFSNKENLKTMRNILTSNFKTDIEVKNGYATLADDVFVQDFNSKFCIPIIKASRGIWTKIIYPYDEEGCLIDEEKLSQDNAVYTHLINYKTKLLARAREDLDNNHWYSFGRSQGLKDTYKNKISINTLIRSAEDLKIINVPSGNGIYSGLYITTSEYNFKEIESALRDTQFGIYVSLLGKYKSGGYYTFSSKDVKKYLNFKLHR